MLTKKGLSRIVSIIFITKRNGERCLDKLRKSITVGCKVHLRVNSEYFRTIGINTSEIGTVLNVYSAFEYPFRVCFENCGITVWCSEDEIKLV